MENSDQAVESATPEQITIAMDQKEPEQTNEQQPPSSATTEDSPKQSEQPQLQAQDPDDSKPSTSTAESNEGGEDSATAVLSGRLGDYNEYHHDSTEDIRKNQLKELAPEHTANIPGIHHHRQYSKVQPESFMWLSVFTLIFFSRIFGALALYKSIRVRLSFKDGLHDEAEEASNAAKKLNIVGMIFCMSWVVLIVILVKGFGVFDPDELV